MSKTANRTFDYEPDYVLFEIENKFVLGYGLDYDEYCRGLPEIYYVNLE